MLSNFTLNCETSACNCHEYMGKMIWNVNNLIHVIAYVFAFLLLMYCSCHVSSSLWSVSKIISLPIFSVRVFSRCHYHCQCLLILVRQVMSAHHIDQMSQKTEMSRIPLCRCSLNIFVFFGQVRSHYHSDQMFHSIHYKVCFLCFN